MRASLLIAVLVLSSCHVLRSLDSVERPGAPDGQADLSTADLGADAAGDAECRNCADDLGSVDLAVDVNADTGSDGAADAVMCSGCSAQATCEMIEGVATCVCVPGTIGDGADCAPAPPLVADVVTLSRLTLPDFENDALFALPRPFNTQKTVPFATLETDLYQPDAADIFLVLELTTPSSILVERDETDGEIVAEITLVEFGDGADVQHTGFQLLEGATEVLLPLNRTVDPDHAFVIFSHQADVKGTQDRELRPAFLRASLEPDTVKLTRGSSNADLFGQLWVVHSPHEHFSVHRTDVTIESTQRCGSVSAPPYDPARAVALHSQEVDGPVPELLLSRTAAGCKRIGDELQCCRGEADESIVTVSMAVVEFAPWTSGTVESGAFDYFDDRLTHAMPLAAPGGDFAMPWTGVNGAAGLVPGVVTDSFETGAHYIRLTTDGDTITARRSIADPTPWSFAWYLVRWPTD